MITFYRYNELLHSLTSHQHQVCIWWLKATKSLELLLPITRFQPFLKKRVIINLTNKNKVTCKNTISYDDLKILINIYTFIGSFYKEKSHIENHCLVAIMLKDKVTWKSICSKFCMIKSVCRISLSSPFLFHFVKIYLER